MSRVSGGDGCRAPTDDLEIPLQPNYQPTTPTAPVSDHDLAASALAAVYQIDLISPVAARTAETRLRSKVDSYTTDLGYAVRLLGTYDNSQVRPKMTD